MVYIQKSSFCSFQNSSRYVFRKATHYWITAYVADATFLNKRISVLVAALCVAQASRPNIERVFSAVSPMTSPPFCHTSQTGLVLRLNEVKFAKTQRCKLCKRALLFSLVVDSRNVKSILHFKQITVSSTPKYTEFSYFLMSFGFPSHLKN